MPWDPAIPAYGETRGGVNRQRTCHEAPTTSEPPLARDGSKPLNSTKIETVILIYCRPCSYGLIILVGSPGIAEGTSPVIRDSRVNKADRLKEV